MLIRWMLLALGVATSVGAQSCVDRVSDCVMKATRHCWAADVGATVRENCPRMCGVCGSGSGRAARRPSRRRPKRRKPARRQPKGCVDNRQCKQWNRNGFCDSDEHTVHTKHWLCPKLCYNCKKPSQMKRKKRKQHAHKPARQTPKPTPRPTQPPKKPEPPVVKPVVKPPPPATKPVQKPPPPAPPVVKPAPPPPPPKPQPLPLNAASLQFKRSIDPNQKPCNDFYNFVCGEFIKQNPPKSPDDNINPFHDARGIVRKRQVELIESNDATTSTAVQKMRKFREKCKDVGPINTLKTTDLWSDVEAMGKGNIFDDSFDANTANPNVMFSGLVARGGKQFLFDLQTKKLGNNEIRMLILPAPLLYKNPAKYFDPKYTQEVEAVRTYIKEVLSILIADVGLNRPNLDADIQAIIDYDKESARIYLANGWSSDREEMAKNAEKRKLSEVSSIWVLRNRDYLSRDPVTSDPEVTNHLLTGDPDVLVYKKDFFDILMARIGGSKRFLAYNYFITRFILDQVPYLDSRFDAPYQKFISAVGEKDVSAGSRRADGCIDECIRRFPYVNDHLYLKNYLKQEEVDKLKDIEPHNAIEELINENKWYDAASKAKAVAKIKTIKEIVIRNQDLLDKEYEQLTIDNSDSYRRAVVKVSVVNQKRRLGLITQPTSVTAFIDFRTTDLNAHQVYFERQTYLPAAMIQPPFHTITAEHPEVLNFGALGWLRARQVLHAIDHNGIDFDETGQRGNWLSAADQPNFAARTQSLLAVYAAQKEPQSQRQLNAKQTQASDIVDHLAIRAAFRAFQQYRKANPTADTTVHGYEVDYTPEQQLFMAFGTAMCASQGANYLDRHVLDKERSPPRIVVNTVVSHYPEFATAFKCAPGSPMNPTPKVELW